tara:strand:- start:341 stop:757 length:417 start_codon:yes stop_codon:yes gene_type:complete
MIIITVAKKPMPKSTTACALENGCGALNIDACRISNADDQGDQRGTSRTRNQIGFWSSEHNVGTTGNGFDGRWPANLLLNTISQEAMDTQSGNCRSNHNKSNDKAGHQNQYVGGKIHKKVASSCYKDSGGASRYFKVF